MESMTTASPAPKMTVSEAVDFAFDLVRDLKRALAMNGVTDPVTIYAATKKMAAILKIEQSVVIEIFEIV